MKHLKEYTRKSIHLVFGVLFLLMIELIGVKPSIIILTAFLIGGVISSILILKKVCIPIIADLITKVERESEKNVPGKAAILFFISAIITMILFQDNKNLILAALSVHIFADAFAAIIGKNFGTHKIYKKKTIEGSTTFFLISFLCIIYFYPFPLALLIAFISTLIELFAINDNLFIPLLTALAIKIFV